MWRWAQGRLAYFQFDNLKALAHLALRHNLKIVDKGAARAETGLPFPPDDYPQLWRNYSRVVKLTLLVHEEGDRAVPTNVARLLAQEGGVTVDEYFHFLARTFTDPSPALTGWSPSAGQRYPLAFALRYGLAKLATRAVDKFPLSEVLSAYRTSGFRATEPYDAFVSLTRSLSSGPSIRKVQRSRQARESLKVISQISYVHYDNRVLSLALDKRDARALFDRLHPIEGQVERTAEDELRRVAALIADRQVAEVPDQQNTIVSEELASGFKEGGKVRKMHMAVERNSKLREAYFEANLTSICDACQVNTDERFPWTSRMLDLHHLLPLSSGTRVESSKTVFSDLAPLCPTCHRGVHRYYDSWLKECNRSDFADIDEARQVYDTARQNIRRTIDFQRGA